MRTGGNLLRRFHLAIIIICQVTIVPTILFAIAYLIDIDLENSSIGLRTEMISWVIIAGLTYGILSLVLSLLLSGFTPFYISNKGGWMVVLGLSRRYNDPELIDRSRLASYSSPHGTMSRLVYQKIRNEKYEVMAVHGGLQLLAVPMQVILIVVPLVIMEGVPESVVKPDSAFQLGMIGYLIALWASIRIHPLISQRLISFAYIFRNILGRFERVSWILPLVLYWLFARFILKLSLGWLGIDYAQWHEIQLEKRIMQAIVDEAIIPETALLDSIVAISVLPMATFTTISVLSGMRKMPDWMLDQEMKLENIGKKVLEAPKERNTPFPNVKRNESIMKEEKGEENILIDSPFSLFDDDQ